MPHSVNKNNLLALILLLVSLIINVSSLKYLSQTYDEGTHLQYGLNILSGNPDRSAVGYLGNSKMPITALNAFPKYILDKLGNPRLPKKSDELMCFRIPTVAASILLGWLVFIWTRRLYGSSAGLFSLFIYVFSPNILAHSQLVTTDIYATATIAWSIYCFYRFLDNPNWKRLLLFGMSTGLSFISKYTSLYLIPQFILIWGLFHLCKGNSLSQIKPKLKIKFLISFMVVVWVIVNSAFLWDSIFLPIKDYKLKSDISIQLQQHLGPLAEAPTLIAYPFIEGIDWVYHDDREKITSGNIYLLGNIRSDRGFPGYYIVALIFKEPIPILIMGILAGIGIFWRFKSNHALTKEIFLFVPVIFFFIFFSFLFNTQVGIRHLLVVYPMVYVFLGSLIPLAKTYFFRLKPILTWLSIYLIVSTLSYHRHYLSYFNEFVWDRKLAYKILADSNLDWGQSQRYLEEYMLNYPEAVFEPKTPTSGKIIVAVNNLVGVFSKGHEQFRWLRENFKPTGHIAYSYLIFDISETALRSINLTPDTQMAPSLIDTPSQKK